MSCDLMSAPEDEATHATALLEACPALSQRAYATTRRDYRDRFDVSGNGPRPLFPPTVGAMEQQQSRKRALPPSCKTPFLCAAAGCLPRGVPDDVDDLLSAYLVSGVSRASPNIDVAGQSVECSSNGQARRALANTLTPTLTPTLIVSNPIPTAGAPRAGQGLRAGQALLGRLPRAHRAPALVACRRANPNPNPNPNPHLNPSPNLNPNPNPKPPWWPAGGAAEAVPGFEHLIVGEGSSGIG